MVRAFFSSNIQGLGIQGMGWEEDIRTSLLAVGVDARAPAGSELAGRVFALTARRPPELGRGARRELPSRAAAIVDPR